MKQKTDTDTPDCTYPGRQRRGGDKEAYRSFPLAPTDVRHLYLTCGNSQSGISTEARNEAGRDLTFRGMEVWLKETSLSNFYYFPDFQT